MPIFRGSGGSGDASTDAYISEVAAFANTATLKASEASASASTASGFADAASASASAASTSADNASNAQTAAELAETNAEAAEAAAVIAQTGAETAEALAEQWATELEDVVVADGKYSAFHWAQKAEDAFIIGTEINSLSDVIITTVTDNEVLAYNAGTSKWVNQTAAEAGLATASQGSLADTAVQPNDSPSFGSITVTGTVDGRDLSVDGAKLDTIASGAQVNVATNLTYSSAASTGTVNSSTGTNATVPAATTSLAGLLTGADKTKLDGIEALADVTDTANVTAAGALMDSELTDITAIKTLQAPDNTTISAYGATLVDDADAGTARTTLGLGTAATATVTTSATDTTTGNLLKVGDFGLGPSGLSVAVDLNDINTTGFFKVVNSGIANKPPFSGTGIGDQVIHQRFDDNAQTQIYTAYAVDRMAYRRKQGGIWKPWVEVYQAGSILGTVSQSSGVPTGAVIERGSNANGEYVKFADGTMICTRAGTVNIAINTSFIGGFRSTTSAITLPATFVNTSYEVSVSPSAVTNYDHFSTLELRSSRTTTQFSVAFTAVTSQAAADHTFTALIVGRWF